MEKIVKPSYDHKEYMRLAMLKHEETFREQVYELHRVYRIQKMLMQSSAVSQQMQQQKQQQQLLLENNNNHKSSSSAFTIDYNQQETLQKTTKSHISNISNMSFQLPSDNQVLLGGGPISRPQKTQDQHIVETNTSKIMLDEGEVELTLSLGPSTQQNPRRRRTESGHESLSSSSTGSSQTRKTSPKDNDNISCSLKRDQFTWGSSSNFPQVSEIEPGFSNGQQNNNPPWMFQALSLKLT